MCINTKWWGGYRMETLNMAIVHVRYILLHINWFIMTDYYVITCVLRSFANDCSTTKL